MTIDAIAEILKEDGLRVAPKRSKHGGLRINLKNGNVWDGFWLHLDAVQDKLYLTRLNPDGSIASYGNHDLADPQVFHKIKKRMEQAPPALR